MPPRAHASLEHRKFAKKAREHPQILLRSRACNGCCVAGECIGATQQGACACNGPGQECAPCPAGRHCVAGWCETSDDVCAYSVAMKLGNDPWMAFQFQETVEGSGDMLTTCGSVANSRFLVGGGARVADGRDLDLFYHLPIVDWPWGGHVALADLAGRGAELHVVVSSTADRSERYWRASASTPGTILIRRESAAARSARESPAGQFSKERYVFEIEGTLFLDGTNANNTMALRILGRPIRII